MTFLHPIIVHFPIALLTLYSILEISRIKKLAGLKVFLVTIGYIGLTAAFISGQGFEKILDAPLLVWHMRFAVLTILLYTYPMLSALYPDRLKSGPILSIILATAGLASLTITGGLGGAIIFGTHFDPLMAPIFKLLKVY